MAHREAIDLDLAQARFANFQPTDGERPDGKRADREGPNGECSKCDLPCGERPYRRGSSG
jgi:hypothetical protein